MMRLPLMPKATAIWLIEHTSLTFAQISAFCGLHIFEVEALANGELDATMVGFDPIVSSQLTVEEIKKCEENPDCLLTLKSNIYLEDEKKRKLKYTPRSKRQDRPDAILWLLKYYPDISEKDLCDLIGTTKITIRAIRNKTHRNSAVIKPRSPVVLGLCSEAELDFVVAKSQRENG